MPLTYPLLGTWPTTQACALTGNWTVDPLNHRLALNPLSHTSQGNKVLLKHNYTYLFMYYLWLSLYEDKVDQSWQRLYCSPTILSISPFKEEFGIWDKGQRKITTNLNMTTSCCVTHLVSTANLLCENCLFIWKFFRRPHIALRGSEAIPKASLG